MSDRLEPKAGEFEDPLENYDPTQYDDPLEEALIEQPVAALETQPYVSVSPDTSVAEAMSMLVGEDIACLLVEENGRLMGVFSDRDVLDRVALEYSDVKDDPVSSLMSADPVFVRDTDSSATALTVMAVNGFRHVPVLDTSDKLIGIVSPRRVTDFLRKYSQKE